MSGGNPPPDNSDKVAQIEAQAARDAREQQAQQEAEKRSRFESSLNSAYSGSVDDARNYFISRGLDPDQYVGAIQRGATAARGRVPDLADAPGTYFDNLGATVYDQERDAARGRLQRSVNQFAPSDFATKRIASTADDATLAAILAEQRSSADQYVRNLLDRGVITNPGYAAAEKDLDTQAFGANARLNEIGNQVLETGRAGANDIANQARQGAANYELGDNFDPYSYSTQIDQSIADFFANLGGNIRSKIPASLFSTSGLAGIAGAAQGAQNTKFDPNAIAGLTANDNKDEEDQRAFLSAF